MRIVSVDHWPKRIECHAQAPMFDVGVRCLCHAAWVSASGPPTGVVTFLFTDVEGSTRRWEADADAMRAALAAHDEVLRGAIEEHGGFMFKHTGDGVCAAFASPRSAVDAAIAAQRALELPVRMGIATGEAELRDGDYFGAVLNRATRVMAAGHGGQVLLADSTAVSAQRRRSGRFGATAVAGSADSGSGVPGPSGGPAHGLSAVAGSWMRVRGICGLRPRASSDASPKSTRCKRRSKRIGW